MSPLYDNGAKNKSQRISSQQESSPIILHAVVYEQIRKYHSDKDKSGEVTTRQMTPEERKKYGLG